jgi:NAD(P)-dependent dehydrogenase (short-subunit alcohol dehydrogenase family)
MTLKNKFAVITGASDGIGLGIAKAFLENGADICLVARNQEKLEIVRQELSTQYAGKIHILASDLSMISGIEPLTKQILDICPRIDILVNNAGVGRFVPFAETSEDILDMHISLNVKAPYLLTQYLLDSLVQTKGAVINISSYFSDRMLPGRATTAYSLTKGAINSFTKALAFEVGKLGVRVNAIAPGSIDTPQLKHNISVMDEQRQKQFAEMIATIYPMQKIGTSEDIAQAAVFLASDNAKWITGIIMPVDGGLTTN